MSHWSESEDSWYHAARESDNRFEVRFDPNAPGAYGDWWAPALAALESELMPIITILSRLDVSIDTI